MICRILMGAFIAIYALAILVFTVGTFGVFGAGRDPLCAVFLIPIGLPWTLLADVLPESARLGGAMMAPLLNLAMVVAAPVVLLALTALVLGGRAVTALLRPS